MSGEQARSPRPRRGYLDWLRGLAVVIMIEAHLLDSWTRFDERDSRVWVWSMVLGGLGAPLFLFLAGLSVSLAASARSRTIGDRAASQSVVRRGLQVFLLAFLFRLQAVVVSWGSWSSMLKVDILNIMGPSIMAAAAIWGIVRSPRARLMAFAAVTLAIAFLTPPVRAVGFLSALPDPIEGYIRPRAGVSAFVLFPWMAFVFAGAFAGVLIERAQTRDAERRINVILGVGGTLLIATAFAASFVPSPFSNSQFWTSSPSFFLIRTGVLVVGVAVAFAWQQRPHGSSRWSPLQQLGRSSLFIYWIHIELIYGLVVRPLHKSLSFGAAWVCVLLFAVAMIACAVLKERLWTPDRITAWRSRLRAAGPVF